MDARFEGDTSQGILTLQGDLTISHAARLKEEFLHHIGSVDTLGVKFSEVEAVDLACVQLLCSAHRMSVKLGKRLFLEKDVPDAVRKIIDDSGFCRHVGCGLDSQGSCIWASLHP